MKHSKVNITDTWNVGIKMKMKGRFIIVFIILLSFSSCFLNRKSCKNADFDRNIVISGLPEGYVPLKNELHLFKGRIENLSTMKVEKADNVLLFSSIEDGRGWCLTLSYNAGEQISTKYNYRLVLDDSLYFDIDQYKIRREIYYTAVSYVVHCRIDTIHVNGYPVASTKYINCMHLPFSLAKKVDE